MTSYTTSSGSNSSWYLSIGSLCRLQDSREKRRTNDGTGDRDAEGTTQLAIYPSRIRVAYSEAGEAQEGWPW